MKIVTLLQTNLEEFLFLASPKILKRLLMSKFTQQTKRGKKVIPAYHGDLGIDTVIFVFIYEIINK